MWHDKMTCISDDCEIGYWGKNGQFAVTPTHPFIGWRDHGFTHAEKDLSNSICNVRNPVWYLGYLNLHVAGIRLRAKPAYIPQYPLRCCSGKRSKRLRSTLNRLVKVMLYKDKRFWPSSNNETTLEAILSQVDLSKNSEECGPPGFQCRQLARSPVCVRQLARRRPTFLQAQWRKSSSKCAFDFLTLMHLKPCKEIKAEHFFYLR